MELQSWEERPASSPCRFLVFSKIWNVIRNPSVQIDKSTLVVLAEAVGKERNETCFMNIK